MEIRVYGGEGMLRGLLAVFVLGMACLSQAGVPDTVERIESSVVAVGTFLRTRVPSVMVRGTGFVVGDGRQVLTNAHVLPSGSEMKPLEVLQIFHGRGRGVRGRRVRLLARDDDHDLALLEIEEGPPLPTLALGDGRLPRPGEEYLFTGFPLGMVLGLYPVTHRAMVSAITPIAIPAGSGRELTAQRIQRLKAPFMVIQLDGTAYPGNSGSPLYDPRSGRVIGILNSVLVKGSKESVLKQPSAIAYAIPIRHALRLMGRPGTTPDRQ